MILMTYLGFVLFGGWNASTESQSDDAFTLPGGSQEQGEEKRRYRRSYGVFPCPNCGRTYLRKDSLQRHTLWECGKDPQFQCPFCPQKCKRKSHHIRHMQRQHKDMLDLMNNYVKKEVTAE